MRKKKFLTIVLIFCMIFTMFPQLTHPQTAEATTGDTIYWDPGNTGGNANDTNSGTTANEPVKTFEAAVNKITTNSGTIISISNMIVSDDTVLDTKGKNITLQRYTGFGGDFFTISSSKSLTLSNIVIDANNSIIAVKGNGTLNIGANTSILNGGVISLETGAKPINLVSQPLSNALYTIKVGSPTQGQVVVKANGNKFSIDNFAINNTGYTLKTNDDGNVCLEAIPANTDGIYVDGLKGNDKNDGLTPGKAVKTLDRAEAICLSKSKAKIYICGTVTINSNKTLNSSYTIERVNGFNESLINVAVGTLTMSGSTIKSTIGEDKMTAVYISGGTFTMSDGTVDGNIVSNSGSFNLDGSNAAIEGTIFLNNTSITLTNKTVANTYDISFQNVQPDTIAYDNYTIGQVVVKGADGATPTDYLANFTLPAGDDKSLCTDGTDLCLRYTNAVFVDKLNGDDTTTKGYFPDHPYCNFNKAIKAPAGILYIKYGSDIDSDYGTNPSLNYATLKNYNIPEGKSMLTYNEVYKSDYALTKLKIDGKSPSEVTANGISMNTADSLTLYGVQISNCGTGLTIANGAKVVMNPANGEFNNITGNDKDVVVAGTFKLEKGTVGNIDVTGQIQLYNDSNITGRFYANNTSSAPINVQERLFLDKIFTVTVSRDMIGHPLVSKGDDGYTPDIANFRLSADSIGLALKQDGDDIKVVASDTGYIYLSGTGDDNNNGLTQTTAVRTFEKAKELLSSYKNYNIIICGTVEITGAETWNFGDNGQLTVDGTTWTPVIYRGTGGTNDANGSLVNLSSGTSLTLNNITIDGNKDINSYGAIITINGNATLKVNNGAVIKNNNNVSISSSKNGGAIANYGGTVVIDGGEIVGNTARYGGGIFSQSDGDNTPTVTIEAGSNIEGNTAVKGGGINFVNNKAIKGTLDINGGNIKENTANNGGGVYTTVDTNISGGIISDNFASDTVDGGGAIMIYGADTAAKLNITGGTIKNNKANNNGGGILANKSTITIDGATISKNTSYIGGGIALVNTSSFILKNGDINNNTSTIGGGVYLNNNCKFDIYGGSIYDNTATDKGGGVYTLTSDINITNGSILNNKAVQGGGIYVATSNVNMYKGSSINENHSSKEGAGVYIVDETAGNYAFNMYDGEISGNYNNSKGGAIYLESDYVSVGLYGGSIENNTSDKGGGIYNNLGKATIDGVIIEDNNAQYGAATYQANDSAVLTLISGTIKNNNTTNSGSEDVHTEGKSLNIEGGRCYIDSSIYSKYPVNVSGAIVNANQVYAIRPNNNEAGTVIVQPATGSTVTDASQYAQNFVYGGSKQNMVLDKFGTSLTLKNVQYIDGIDGNDENNGYTPAQAKKSLPDTLIANTIYYIVGTIEITDDIAITGTSSSRIVRYTGFDVQGAPHTAFGGNMFDIKSEGKLTLNDVKIAGKRSSIENYQAYGYIIKNGGTLSLKGATELTDNQTGAVYLTSDNVIEASALSTSSTTISVNVEDVHTDRVVVSGNTNVSQFEKTANITTHSLTSDGTVIVLSPMNEVYVDPKKDESGDGLTPEGAFKTFEEAKAYFGGSDGIVYVVNTLVINSDTTIDGNGKIIIKKYKTLSNSMIEVTSGGQLTLNNVVLDGNKSDNTSKEYLLRIHNGAKAIIEGNSVLKENAHYIVNQSGTLTLKDAPVLSGVIFLGNSCSITDGGYTGSISNPLQITIGEAEPDDGRVLITDTGMTAEFVTLYIGLNTGLNDYTVNKSGTNIVLNKKIFSSEDFVIVDGTLGNDSNDGKTNTTAVKTFTKAYELLKENGGYVYVYGTTNVDGKISISDNSVTQNNIVKTLDEGKTICISRRSEFYGSLFDVKMGGLLDIGKITIDGIKTIKANSSIINVLAGGQLKTNSTVFLNINYDSYGGAINNNGVYTMKDTTIRYNEKTLKSPILQGNVMYISGRNNLEGQSVYVKNGCYITVEDVLGQITPIIIQPQTIAEGVKVATADYGTATGNTIISNFAVSSDVASKGFGIKTSGKDIILADMRQNATITLSDYNETYNGNNITYKGTITKTPEQMSDSPYTLYYKLSTQEDSQYTTTVPVKAGEYNVKAVIKNNQNYFDTESNVVTFTINQAIPVVATAVSANTVYVNKTLGDAVLSGSFIGVTGSELEGTLTWDEGNDTVLTETGSHAYTFTPTDIVNYEAVHGNLDVTVLPIPTINITTEPVTNTDVTVGNITASLSVAATVSDDSTPTYQWYKNSVEDKTGATEIDEATAASYAIPTDLTEGTYYYYCKVSAANAEDVYTNFAKVIVTAKPIISITTQPTNNTEVTVGKISGSLEVSATVSDDSTPTYQWYSCSAENKTGASIIDGETGTSYTIPTNLAEGTYYYYCKVSATNADDVDTNVVKVTVIAQPTINITKEPVANKNVIVGTITGSLEVTATVTNSSTPTYQWYKCNDAEKTGATEIDGETGTSYTIPTDLTIGTYYYFCRVSATNADDVDTIVTEVNVVAQPTISIETQPVTNTSVTVGSITGSISVSATVTDGSTPTYQWYSCDTDEKERATEITGETGTSYTIPTDLTEGTYYYYCKVSATNADDVDTIVAKVTVENPRINITSEPVQNTVVTVGSITGNLNVTATVTDGSTPTYQWYSCDTDEKAGATEITGETGTSYTIPTDLAEGTYYYFCRVSATNADDVDTIVAKVTATTHQTINIIVQPTANTEVTAGSITGSLNVTATVSNGSTPTYQWYKCSAEDKTGAAIIDEATETSLTIPTDLTEGTYYYFCRVSATNADDVDTNVVKVTVSAPLPVLVNSIVVTASSNSINTKGGTLQLNAEVLPINATNKNVTWSINDTAIASINQSGLLRAIKNGTVIVTATAQDGSGISGSLEITISKQNVIIIDDPQPEPTPEPQPKPDPSGEGEINIPVIVDGNDEYIGKGKEDIIDDTKTTIVTVDEDKLEEKIGGKNDIEVVVTVPGDNPGASAILTGQMIQDMEDKNITLVIKTSDVDYVVPVKEIDISDISDKIGKTTDLKDINIDVSISKSNEETVKVIEDTANKGKFQLVLSPVDFVIKATYGDKTIYVSKFDNFVSRLIRIPEGVDPSKITTGVVKNEDGSVRHVPTEVIVIDGVYYAKINSLTNSTYTVIYNPQEFNDMKNHWAKDQVNEMYSRMVINGVSEGVFEPDRGITRAEFAAIIVRALGLKPEGIKAFDDANESDWFYTYVGIANQYGIINGVGDNKFEPLRQITREEAMLMVQRAAKIAGIDVNVLDSDIQASLAKFSDGNRFSSWSAMAAVFNIENGLIQGYNGMANPKANITRAETAVIIMRMLQKAHLIDDRIKA